MPKKLEHKIYAIPNSDKLNHETWDSGRDLLNFPCPFRAIFTGRPNSGKSTVIKNLVIRANPAYEQVYLLHPDGDDINEYEDLGSEIICLKDIPPINYWKSNKEKKKLLIIDDFDLGSLNKRQSKNLDRLLAFCSTHCFLSICITAQDYYRLPVNVRRYSDIYFIWKSRDKRNLKSIAPRIGLTAEEFMKVMDSSITGWYDFLTINFSKGAPVFLAKNVYDVLIKEY